MLLMTALLASGLAATIPAKECGSAMTQTVSLGALADKAGSADIIDTAVAAGSFKTLAAALTAAGLIETLKGEGPFTVFAPTDEAFAKLPKGTVESLLKPENKSELIAVLTYHVVPGKVMADKVTGLKFAETVNGQRVDIAVKDGTVMIDGATVIKADVAASNGVIHVIDRVILPSSQNVVEVARENGFSTLAAAIEAAGLTETLSGKGPFTVFAPTDAAFAKLPKGTLERLLMPENKAELAKILTYHVVPGRVFSDKAMTLTSAKSVQGGSLVLKVVGGKLMIDNAAVTAADIEASNGVIHVIDSVVLPK